MTYQRKPDEIDRQRAREVAVRRKHARVSQLALAEHLEISAQQLSKYERGLNRMSISVYERAIEFLERAKNSGDGFSESQSPFRHEGKPVQDFKTILVELRRCIDLLLAQL